MKFVYLVLLLMSLDYILLQKFYGTSYLLAYAKYKTNYVSSFQEYLQKAVEAGNFSVCCIDETEEFLVTSGCQKHCNNTCGSYCCRNDLCRQNNENVCYKKNTESILYCITSAVLNCTGRFSWNNTFFSNKVPWVSFIISIVFSSTFLTVYVILILLYPELRRVNFFFATWNFWLMGSILVFLVRVCTGVYHATRITLDLWMFVGTNMINKAFRTFQCVKNLYKQDLKEFLLSRLDEAKNYDEWHEISLKLDKIERWDEWRNNPQYESYDWKQLKEHLRRLRECRSKGDERILMFLLRSSCNRNFCNLSSTELFGMSRVGTKRLIDEYEDEVCEALNGMCLLFDEAVNQILSLKGAGIIPIDMCQNKSFTKRGSLGYPGPRQNLLLPKFSEMFDSSLPCNTKKCDINHSEHMQRYNRKEGFPVKLDISQLSSSFSLLLANSRSVSRKQKKKRIQGKRKKEINVTNSINEKEKFVVSDDWIDIGDSEVFSKGIRKTRQSVIKENNRKRKLERNTKATKQVQTIESTFAVTPYAFCDSSIESVPHLPTSSKNYKAFASEAVSEARGEVDANERLLTKSLQRDFENTYADSVDIAKIKTANAKKKFGESDFSSANSFIEDNGLDIAVEPCLLLESYASNGELEKNINNVECFRNPIDASPLKLDSERNNWQTNGDSPETEMPESEELKNKLEKINGGAREHNESIKYDLPHENLLSSERIQKQFAEACHRDFVGPTIKTPLISHKPSSPPMLFSDPYWSSLLVLHERPFALSMVTSSAKVDSLNASTTSPAHSQCASSLSSMSTLSANSYKTAFHRIRQLRHFFSGMRLSMGRTALCLSGGGALAMYHLGVVKALAEQCLLPRVISGASGGAIVAALLARYSDEELLSEMLKPDISQRYGVRWFPPVIQQIKHFVSTGCMINPVEFEETCKKYFQDWTFAECFEITGRLVSIVVTPAGRHHGEPLVLNCINTPDVLLWSAVAVSCALPGLMPPLEIMSKNSHGEITPYFPLGLKWMDGSIKSDIPQKELSSLFNVKEFIVSQVNPHAAPFVKTHSSEGQFLRSIENWLTLDIKSRYAVLAQFNMVPKIFGQNISTFWMMQEFEGHVTITPRASLFDWYRLINHPSEEDMRFFISAGESRTWCHIPRIKHMLKIEQELRRCWVRVEGSYARLKSCQSTSV